MRTALCAIVCLLTCAVAHARGEDGSLGLMVRPNDGAPAFVTPGGSFDVLAKSETPLALRAPDGSEWPLDTAWGDAYLGLRRGVATVPATCPPGLHALVAGDDTNMRSVAVLEAYPTAYTVIHLHEPAVGEGNGPSLAALLAPLAAPEPTDAPPPQNGEIDETVPVEPAPVFVLLTGNLTQTGAPAEYLALLRELDAIPWPTVVVPGPADGGTAFARHFGPLPAAFRFGKDGFMLLDTSGYRPLADESPDMGRVHLLRQELMDCRWTVAAAARYSAAIGVRAQLILYVDNPLDGLVTGMDAPDAPPPFPWGGTRLLATPPLAAGSVRVIPFGTVGFGSGGMTPVTQP
jgi:hypothetical protein